MAYQTGQSGATRQGNFTPQVKTESQAEIDLRKNAEGRLIGMRINRYSWWVHWRELADYYLPRRYKWLITPNQMARGSPINQHILDSTATLAAYKCAAGMMSGTANPTRKWFQLRIDQIDSTQTSEVSLWLAEVERLLFLIFAESNFYTSMATALLDLIVFGTCSLIEYEDFDNVVCFYVPCLGEFYLDNDYRHFTNVLCREFTLTVAACVKQFGLENCSPQVQQLYWEGEANLTRELVVAHCIEPNDDGRPGVDKSYPWREIYWEWGGSASPQGGSNYSPGLLRKNGFHEQPFFAGRWDLVSNDPYGRSPGMDGLPDTKQLQQEVKRKAQAIDKMVNPPLVADAQLKNQPASLLPGAITYISGMVQQAKPGFAPVYTVDPKIKEMMEDLNEVRERLNKTFYVDVFQALSQYETRSNITVAEIDQRKAEAFLMLGPVFERFQNEVLGKVIDRTFAIASRAGIFPPAPREVQGRHMTIKYKSMLEIAQTATEAAGIERIFALVGNLAGADPQAMDNVDFDYGIDKISHLLNNDPKLIRDPRQLAQIRQQRQQQAAQQQQADMAEKMSKSAQVLSQTDVGGSRNALQAITGAT